MAQVVTVPQAEWKAYFNQMSKALIGKRAEIEVASLELGDQIAVEWIPHLHCPTAWQRTLGTAGVYSSIAS